MASRSDRPRPNSLQTGPLSHPGPDLRMSPPDCSEKGEASDLRLENGAASDLWLKSEAGSDLRLETSGSSAYDSMTRSRRTSGSDDAAVSVRMARKSGRLQWNARRLYLFGFASHALALSCLDLGGSCCVRLLQFPFLAVH
jgi:hypothetical protein